MSVPYDTVKGRYLAVILPIKRNIESVQTGLSHLKSTVFFTFVSISQIGFKRLTDCAQLYCTKNRSTVSSVRSIWDN